MVQPEAAPDWLPGGTSACVLALAVLVLSAVLVEQSAAQVIRGQVVDATTQEPIPSAFVALLDSAGQQRGGALSGNTGAFILRVPQAGRYTLRAERIGYEDSRSRILTVRDKQTVTYRFAISTKAVDLEGLKVTGRERCRVSREMGTETLALWGEVRKALSIAVWGDEERGVPYQSVLWSRTRSMGSLEILADTVHMISGYGRTPFVSESARSLGAKGYVERKPDGTYMFYGVDAKTLLSNDFLTGHCFRVREAGRNQKGLVGLGFEPLHADGPPDINGTLWVDRKTSELRYLEFKYNKIPMPGGLPLNPFGGRMYFRRLANGDWVVDRWWLRMPQSVTVTEVGDLVRTQLRIHEQGGRIRFIGTAGTSEARGRSTLRGTVYDSTRAIPLAGANVFLTDLNRVTTTDLVGQFEFRDLPAGEHQVAFTHPYLDSLGLAVSPRTVAVDPNHYVSVELAIPQRSTCPADTLTGGVVGFLEDKQTGDPLPATVVYARWWVPGATGLFPTSPHTDTQQTTSDAYGRYLFCHVPLRREIDLGVDNTQGLPGQIRQVGQVQLNTSTLLWQQLLIRR